MRDSSTGNKIWRSFGIGTNVGQVDIAGELDRGATGDILDPIGSLDGGEIIEQQTPGAGG